MEQGKHYTLTNFDGEIFRGRAVARNILRSDKDGRKVEFWWSASEGFWKGDGCHWESTPHA